MSVDKLVIDDYEARFREYEDKVNTLAADLLEERSQRREVGEALVRVTEERDQFRQHVLDIDAHATPYGDIPGEPGWVGFYLLTAGALHRALGKIGHTAPKCQAEAERDEALAEVHQLHQRGIEHVRRHHKLFDEWMTERAQLVDDRDAARDEVVRLGRSLEEWKAALREANDNRVQMIAAHRKALAEIEQWKQAFGEDGLRTAKARLLDALGRSRRPWTDDEVTVKDDGTRSTRVHVKRACNGCGDLLGDVTEEEMDRAVAGLPREDVRGECLTCTPLPSPAVSLDALSREVVRLRTIIGELGAAEAAEPPPDLEHVVDQHPDSTGHMPWCTDEHGGRCASKRQAEAERGDSGSSRPAERPAFRGDDCPNARVPEHGRRSPCAICGYLWEGATT